LRRQLNFGIERNAVFCLGEGKNFHYLSRLNEEYGFFEDVVPLSHPVYYAIPAQENGRLHPVLFGEVPDVLPA
jgi:hypothetical protein